MGLYSHVRSALKALEIAGATKSVAAASGVSTTSMVACCAHHLTDVAAVIGLSAISAALAKYQVLFLITGILSNLVGITMMLELIQSHGLGGGVFESIMRFDMKKVKRTALYLSLFLFLLSYLVMYGGSRPSTPTPAAIQATTAPPVLASPKTLPPAAASQDNIEFIVTPRFLETGEIAFDISIDTHSGALDFDLANASIVKDGNGNTYQAVSWEGSPPGGHHRSGVLKFPVVERKGTLTLVIAGIGSNDRVFTWNLDE